MIDVERVEKKYPINAIDMHNLKEGLKNYMQSDAHNGRNSKDEQCEEEGYIVRSVYFDSLSNTDYYAKTDGIDDRKKIRLRIYSPEDAIVKLELKEKKDGRQRKRSIPITREEAKQLLAGEYSFLFEKDDALSKTLYFYMTKEIYRPKCIIEYDRYAFISEVNDTRVTFDQNLRCSANIEAFFDDNISWIPVADKSLITMEVKYNRFLMSNIKKAISNKITLEASNSKYCRAREKLKIQ